MDVQKRLVIITGVAYGIGQYFAPSPAAAGALVAADVNDCLTTLDLVRGKGGKAFGVMLDVRDSAFAREMVGAATGALTH